VEKASTVKATADFLARLRALDIRLSLDGDRLNCSAPKGVLTGDLRAELLERKPEIIELLRQSNAAVERSIPLISRDGTLLLSSAQRRLWFLQRYAPESNAYNIPFALRLSGPLDARRFAEALRATVARHESLRTCFGEADGVPFARVLPAVDWVPDVHDWSHLDRDTFETSVNTLVEEVGLQPFDLESAPLLRVAIVRRAHDDHAVILVVHHIVADVSSQGNQLRDAAIAYQQQIDPAAAPQLPALPVQFVDYVHWLEEEAQQAAAARQLTYWERHLASPLPVMEIPTDRPRPAIATNRGTCSRYQLQPAIVDSVRDCGRRHGTTAFVVLLTAFKVLLHRYTQQNDILVGSATASRTRAEVEQLIGLFSNTMVLRTHVEGMETGRALIERVRNTVLDASEAEVPFEQLVASLPIQRDLSHSPLVQVMFTLQNYPMAKTLLPGVLVEPTEFATGSSRFDLTVEAFERDGGLQLEFEYNTDLFDAQTIARLQVHYERLLTGLIANTDCPVGELPMLTDAERDELVEAQRATRTPYADGAQLHELLDAVLTGSPDRIAVRCGDDVRTCADVLRQSKNLAGAIRSRGLGAGDIVAVCLERSADMPATLLGVLRSGAAYVPLDPIYPADRIEYMLADSGARLILAHRSVAERLPGDVETLWVDEGTLKDEPAWEKPEAGSSTDLAYVIYTSGSTGRPKGVEITHRALVNFLESMRVCPGLDAHDRLLAVTTLCFDIAGLEMYLPLLAGAELVIATREQTADPDALQELFAERRITVMQATPSTWRMLLEAGWEGNSGFRVFCGGEAMAPDLADRLRDADLEVWNLYGPTETTIWSTVERVGTGPVTVGRPIANTSLYVLDANRQLLPSGVPGELYIGGDGVARGYRNRPDLTSARFVPDPFLPGSFLYRTGDLARWTPNGTLELLGRMDRQVKLRGFRIELPEIEATLKQLDGVTQAVVIVDGVAGRERLLAYVTLAPGAALDSNAARSALARRLPDYMVPAAVLSLPKLPLTPNNKVDVKALPAPEQVAITRGHFAPASNATEQEVAEIWRTLLRVERVGRDDNFFDLGGHSLLLVQMQNRLQARFGKKPTLVDLFKRPTVAAVAGLLQSSSVAESSPVPATAGTAA
jgi:amino acid adenylation domain-containing protein